MQGTFGCLQGLVSPTCGRNLEGEWGGVKGRTFEGQREGEGRGEERERDIELTNRTKCHYWHQTQSPLCLCLSPLSVSLLPVPTGILTAIVFVSY
jgi:hypothetical protein